MKTYLITGGAGFIGCNYAQRLLQRGERVIVYDNLSRAGAQKNVEWLREHCKRGELEFLRGDVRDFELLSTAVARADVVVHLAAQVAVTCSVRDPREDFEINALGTLNVLEAGRISGHRPAVIYASTNKVYGNMGNAGVRELETRYEYSAYPRGVSEDQALDFQSPYGCSKGSGDQYARDYHRIYGLPTVVFRQSCIYGPHQYGIEDQGWVAWFMIAALSGQAVTIYGDGKQVRDLLYIDDLLDAYDLAVSHIDVAAGEVFNIGGGSLRSLSIWAEFGPLLQDLAQRKISVQFKDWRQGDQKVYISDVTKLQAKLNWEPCINPDKGLAELFQWLRKHCEPGG